MAQQRSNAFLPGAAVVDDVPHLVVVLDRLGRSVRQILGRLGRSVDDLESFDRTLADLRQAIRVHFAAPSRAIRAPALASVRRERRLRSALRLAAQSGIQSMGLKPRRDGSALVRIDGKRIELPRRLADLFVTLAAQSESDDSFVPHAELGARNEQKSGRALTPRARTELVYRLKQTFLDAGLSQFLIDSSRRKGVRLLVGRRRLA